MVLSGRIGGVCRKRAGFKTSKDSLLLFLIPISHLVPLLEFNQNREAIAPAAGAHRRRGHAQTTAQARCGTLEAAQRIAGHADSRTTKLYDRRGQKVLLEDMERIRY